MEDSCFVNKIKEVSDYVSIINEYRQHRSYSPASIDFMNNALLKGMRIFQEKIESAPGFNIHKIIERDSIESKWETIKAQTSEIIASEKINIPTLHIMFLKFVLLSDYFQITDPESKNQFGSYGRVKYLINSYCKYDTNIDWSWIIDLKPFKFVNGISDTSKINLSMLANLIPILNARNEDPHFGILTFFYAFFRKIGITCYAIDGSSTAHGGYIASFKKESAWASPLPKEQLPKIWAEKFSSSLLFLAHDLNHIEIYGNIFSPENAISFDNYKNFFEEIIQSASHNPHHKIDLAILFLLTHEFDYKLPTRYKSPAYNLRTREQILKLESCEKELILFIYLNYPPAQFVKPSLNENYMDSHPEEYKQSQKVAGIIEFADIGNLMKKCGMAVELNPEEPWKWGPILAEKINAHLRTSLLWGQFMSHVPEP